MWRAGEAYSGPAVAVALLLACLHASAAHAHVYDHKPGYKICPPMDIRNELDKLMKLRNCTVIEGQLSIVLLEKATAKSFENISFPELKEVTGFIKIYRLKGLRSLGDLFPNLSVIRGITLFRDYSLVIYGNENLQSLGLHSLSRIERGAIRIEQNDRLCYAKNIDWSRIVINDNANNIIKNNYDTRLCGLCPESEGHPDGRVRTCPRDSNGRSLCWDERHCQKLCPSACGERACMSDGTCCHVACVGGCDGPTQHECHVCRYYSLGFGNNRTCVSMCPAGTYKFLRRCVSELECRNMPPSPDGKKYKTFNDTCIYTCPSGYMEKGDSANSTCVSCPEGGCVRYCPGGVIDSMNAAANYRGCTHIRGTVSIMLRASGGNTMAELESSLGEIREIEGFLRVIRSHSLVSLSFLKSLRKIVGKDFGNSAGKDIDTFERRRLDGGKKQSLYIFNNPNLELLWNWTKHGSIEIVKGKLFIHLNPKLCYNLIEPLRNMTKDPDSKFDELEVSESNNGDQASCFQDLLHLEVSMLHKSAVVLRWNTYCLEDTRKLLGYSIYYIIAEYNITQYERRDACYDSWNVLDVANDEGRNNSMKVVKTTKSSLLVNTCSDMQPIFQVLTQLIPFTRYAAYVKTFTTLQDKRGAQSPIIYFKTLPAQPSPPMNVVVETLDPHSAYIKWSPPSMPNGTISVYRVEVQANDYNRPEISRLDYCRNPSAFANLISQRSDDSQEKKKYLPSTGDVKDKACSCEHPSTTLIPPRNKLILQVESAAESIEFENALQNEVYVKKVSTNHTLNRIRRAIDNSLVILSNHTIHAPSMKLPNVTDDDDYFRTGYYETSGKRLSLTVDKLRHFTWYTVSVWACRDKDDNEGRADYEKSWCSNRASFTFRTAELVNADIVTKVRAEIISSNKTLPAAEVNVTWEPPHKPNGFVVAYDMHHSRIEANTPKQSQDVGLHSCLSADDFENSGRGYLLRNLAPGNYSIKVTPVTIGGPGNISAEIFVFIPERGMNSSYEWVWGIIGGCLVMLIVLGGGVWYVKKGLLPAAEANKLFASVNPEYVSTVYVPDEWEVPRSSIEYGKELGQGSFGMVYEGIAKNIIKDQPETRCAVKTVNEHATDRERIEFLNEASVMKAFDTWHVVRLLGVVSRGQPTLVVMELMELGDLKSYLRSHRPDADGSLSRDQPRPVPPSLTQIQQMAIEIADGMAYLSAKKFVHRDLAARNCMVAGDLTVKVGDFGMTRDIYETDYYRKGTKGLLPVRWMSPESLKDGVFSSNSDVWSFGVVLWEMATLAMQPYQGLSNEQVLRYVVEGGVMERPEHCPDRLYELMRACWAHKPASRPSFLQLVNELAPTSATHFRQRSFFHTTQGQELYKQQRINMDEELELTELNVGGSGSNLFGVSGRLASWVREMSHARGRVGGGGGDDDAAAEPLAPSPAGPAARSIPLKSTTTPGPNGVLRDRSS